MGAFRSPAHLAPAHLASWASLCPGNNASAGRQRTGKTCHGNVFLKTALVTAAITGSRRKGTYLAEKYRRIAARRGKMRAAIAIAHKILLAIWHMLRNGTFYQDLGAAFLDRLHRTRTVSHLVRRLSSLGYTVQLQQTVT